MTTATVVYALGVCVVASPAILLAVLGGSVLLGIPLTESRINRLTQTSVVAGLAAAVMILAVMLSTGSRQVEIELGNWVVIPEQHFHFNLKFVFDRLSVPFTILSFLLCGVVSVFTSRYLHRESGYTRFFVCYSVFLLGMVTSSVAGTIETLFAGWELVGLSSALLVAYFHERPNPVRNGLHVWSVYRIADAAFLVAAVALHHLSGEGDFTALMGTGPWPEGTASLTSSQALFIGSLLLIAVAGKSALLPFSGWLPRAMEGPTPSSAIFYGALSVHLGAFLLLRVAPILELSLWLSLAVIVLGLATSLFGVLAAHVQCDIKNALAFASLTQVGIIVAEIGCGLRYIALVHILGHACLRTLQFLRAPSLLHDYHQLENAVGSRLSHQGNAWNQFLPHSIRSWWYRFALERGYLDIALYEYVVTPFTNLFRFCSKLEDSWIRFVIGKGKLPLDVERGEGSV